MFFFLSLLFFYLFFDGSLHAVHSFLVVQLDHIAPMQCEREIMVKDVKPGSEETYNMCFFFLCFDLFFSINNAPRGN